MKGGGERKTERKSKSEFVLCNLRRSERKKSKINYYRIENLNFDEKE